MECMCLALVGCAEGIEDRDTPGWFLTSGATGGLLAVAMVHAFQRCEISDVSDM